MSLLITFLIGNGFDLAAGLKTSYPDFYDWYCNNPSSPDKEDSECIVKFKKEILKYKDKWAECEIELAHYTKEYTADNENEFIECYEDLHTKMAEYIRMVEKEYKDNLITDEAIESFCNGIINFYQELSPQEQKIFKPLMNVSKSGSITFSFISFNYTNILDRYIIRSVKKHKSFQVFNTINVNYSMSINANVLHIHGTTDHFPILGVGNESDVANKDLLKNSEINCDLLKQSCIDSLGEVWYEDANNLIDGSTIVCIFGMSLGQSDSHWWEKIVDWLNKDSHRHLIIFWHSPEPKNNCSAGKRDTQIKTVQKKLLDYSKLSQERKSNTQKRIHVVLNAENMLKVPAISRE